MDAKTIGSVAAAIGMFIKFAADSMGEPVAPVRKRVLDRVEADARDSTDETDDLSAAIDAAMPKE